MSKKQGSLFSYDFVGGSLQSALQRVKSLPSSPEALTQSSTPEEENCQASGTDSDRSTMELLDLHSQLPSTDLGKYSETEIVRFTNEPKYCLPNYAFISGLQIPVKSKVF